MAVPTGTFQQYQAIGTREDLANIIYDISPEDTPVMANIGRGSASQVLVEWQTDALAAASTSNAQIEGDDANTNTATPTTRFGNRCQIFTKVPRVSGTLRASNTAGRKDELSYQLLKRSKELKRDIETTICSTHASTAGAAASARAMAGMACWLFGNQVQNGTAATTPAVTSGVPGTAPTAGTTAAFTEAMLQSALALCWDDGGDPSMVVMRSADKRLASAFTGIATQYRDNAGSVGPAVVVGAADIYVSDWGVVYFVASRFMPAGNVYCIDPEYWEIAYLRPIQKIDLAKTGDSERKMLLAECTLIAKEPNSSAKIYTTTS